MGDLKILAFIGAREGSKGLLGKNIKEIHQRPLIAWTIEAALKAKCINKVIVSTDCEEIVKIAKKEGAQVPFLRPKHFATDEASSNQALQHCLQWVKENTKEEYDYVIMLQPTSPLRTAEHIEQAFQHYFKERSSPSDTLVSVVKVPEKIAWLMQANQQGHVEFCFQQSNLLNLQRQNNKTYYLPNGAIYIAPAKFENEINFYTDKTIFFEMDEKDSIDIDTLADFIAAETRLKQIFS